MSKPKQVKTDEYTIKSGHLDVGDGHKVWFEQWGNPQARVPILLFHGGPGSEFKPKHKYSFDPQRQQIIGFDQRGSGNSLPYGSLKHNTTDNLLSDALKILDELGINQAYIYGMSWGSTLALLFSIKHPGRVRATIVSGIFTGSKAEIDYLSKGYFSIFYPEVWQRFQDSVPKAHRENPAAYHYSILTGKDHTKFAASAKALDDLERPILSFDWRGYNDIVADDNDNKYDHVPYQMFAHYISNNYFMPDRHILDNAHRINTPLYIVQGRYDMCCPPATAYELHCAASGSNLYITLGSHAYDPENRTALTTLVSTVFI